MLASMQSTPLVSAIIPVYNGEKYIAQAIDSVLRQTYPSVECVIVDDGSTDATPRIIGGYGDRVRSVRKQNGGVASARNAGVGAAKGEYIAFLDADDVWLAEKTDVQMRLFEANPNLGLVYSALQVVDENLNPIDVIQAPPAASALRNSLLMEVPIMATSNSAIVPARVFHEIGGYDERLSTSADTDFACRVACRYPVEGIRSTMVLYRQHGSQMHLSADALWHDNNILYPKLFESEHLPNDIRKLRRRAYANLYSALAIRYLADHRIGKSVWCGLIGFSYHPLRPLVAAAKVIQLHFRRRFQSV
jgi:glycosyltransferase involved in cell wall biosynthesis